MNLKQTQRGTRTQEDKQEEGDRNEAEWRLNVLFLISSLHTNPFPHHLHIPQHTHTEFCLVMLRLLCAGETVFRFQYSSLGSLHKRSHLLGFYIPPVQRISVNLPRSTFAESEALFSAVEGHEDKGLTDHYFSVLLLHQVSMVSLTENSRYISIAVRKMWLVFRYLGAQTALNSVLSGPLCVLKAQIRNLQSSCW